MDPGTRVTLRTALSAGALLLVTLGNGCPEADERPDAGATLEPLAAHVSASPTPAVTFEATVRPILATRCAPCHNPGGKMYPTLPFDQPSVVSSHAAGVRRRLKDEDLAALEKWLATLPPADPDTGPPS